MAARRGQRATECRHGLLRRTGSGDGCCRTWNAPILEAKSADTATCTDRGRRRDSVGKQANHKSRAWPRLSWSQILEKLRKWPPRRKVYSRERANGNILIRKTRLSTGGRERERERWDSIFAKPCLVREGPDTDSVDFVDCFFFLSGNATRGVFCVIWTDVSRVHGLVASQERRRRGNKRR